ncbi:MAG: PilZ domain-containing protein [Sphingomonadaceae bacterium]
MIFSRVAAAEDGEHTPRRMQDFGNSNFPPISHTADSNDEAGMASSPLRSLRPCGITARHGSAPGFIRHLSSNGAQIETQIELTVGDEIHYFWDGLPPLKARVAWSSDGLVGLRNLPQEANQTSARVPRALRVACRLPARIDRGRETFKGFVGNISQRGVLVYGVPGMEAGSRIDLSVCGHMFPDAEVRWSRAGCVGVALREQIDYETISGLMDRAALDEVGSVDNPPAHSSTGFGDGKIHPFDPGARVAAFGGFRR